ncbi:hypothetical protein KI387_032957, partial [Taxus chinensis]
VVATENILSLSRDVAPALSDNIGEDYFMESVEKLKKTKVCNLTIEIIIVFNTEVKEPSVRGEKQSTMQTKHYEVNHIVNTHESGTSNCNTEAQGIGEDDLSLQITPQPFNT